MDRPSDSFLAEAHGGLILAAKQRSPEWHQKRAGKITASRFCDVMAVSKKTGQPLKAYEDYKVELAVERLSGKAVPGGGGAATLWGIDVEPYARFAVEADKGCVIDEADFILHPDYPFIGASPDGWISPDSGYEGKAPFSMIVHLETLLHGMPEEHIPQVQGGMWVSDLPRWLFASYDPRQHPRLRLYLQEVSRDDAYIAKLEAACLKLNAEVDALVQEILAKYPEQEG